MKYIFIGAFCSLLALSCLGQSNHNISGYIKDATNEEVLIGASVVIHELAIDTISNVYGFYHITLPNGNCQISYKYIGYNDVQNTLNLAQDIRMDVELPLAKKELDEVVITGRPIVEDPIITVGNPEMEVEIFEKFPKFETLCRILSE